MAVSLKHAFVSPVLDDGKADEVGPNEWNAEHEITTDQDTVLGRVSTGAGAVEPLTPAQVRTLINVEDGAQVNTVDSVNGQTGAVVLGDLSDDDASAVPALTMTGNIDLDGNDLIVDADGDSYIHEVSDDVIGVVVAGSQRANFNQYGIGIGASADASYLLSSKNDVSGISGYFHENAHASGSAAVRLGISSGRYCQMSANTSGEIAGFLTNMIEFYIQNARSGGGNIRIQTVNGGSIRFYAGSATEVMRAFDTYIAMYKPFGNSPVAVSALPAASLQAGLRAIVNDATATTFASTVAGGGANVVPVYSDGTNWKIG